MNSNSNLTQQLQSLLDDLVQSQSNVQNGVLLVEGPGWKWTGASGLANPELALPMLPEDQFNVDSISKTMTATIVMKLVENEEIRLEDQISRYLPPTMIQGLHVIDGQSYGEGITLEHLLNHTSGIADNWAIPGFLELIIADPQKRWTPEEVIEYTKSHSQPSFPPGGGFRYSDPGYNLLGLIIEKVTGCVLHELFRDWLLEPLGMVHTYRPSHEEAIPSIPGRGPSSRYLDDMECTLLPAVMTADWAGGGLISTVEDLNRFIRAFVNNEIFVAQTTRDAMFKWVDSGPFHNYGLGISRVLFDQSKHPLHKGLGEVWGHTGSSDNFMYYWPQEDVTLIGTLNQIDSDKDLYDNVALIMKTLRSSKA